MAVNHEAKKRLMNMKDKNLKQPKEANEHPKASNEKNTKYDKILKPKKC